MIKSAKNILLLCLMLVGCAQTEEVNDHLVWRLDPVKVQRMDLKQIVDSICIVPLETNDSCLIKKVHSLEYAHGKFYVNNAQKDLQVYDGEGRFLYGTKKYLGPGPNDYVSAMSVCVLGPDSFEICDALALKVRRFVYPKGFLDSWSFSEEVLPLMQYERLNGDSCVFVGTDALKLYSRSEREIIKEYGVKHEIQFSKVSWALRKEAGILFYSDIYPANELYVLTSEGKKELAFRLDFGEHNFSLEDVSDGLDPAYYYAFMSEHPEFAYPFQKFISGDHYVAYFQFEGKLCVAFKKGKDGRTLLFTNEPYARSQLMIPHYVNKGKLYYASEPAYLSYVVDTTLMSREDIGKMNRVDEMDNPIIVVYNLR